jgi:tetratricopeptide (TPR) repeat protein
MATALTMILLCGTVAASDPKAEARERFDRGVTAFNDRRFADAANEFNAAYQISPVYGLLYNIGQVSAALGNSVEAVDAFEKYLAQGGAAIAESRRTEVQAELEIQRARIGTISLSVQPDGAEIRVDSKVVGKSPLKEPLRVTAGKHAFVMLAEGYAAQARELDVAPRTQMELEVRLEMAHGDNGVAVPPPSSSAQVVPPKGEPASATTPVGTTAMHNEPILLSPPVSDRENSVGNVQRGLGYTVGAVGIALVGSGVVLAIAGANQASTAQTRMTSASDSHDPAAWDRAHSDLNSAKSLNRLGLEGVGLGSAFIIGGGLLVLTAPSARYSTAWTVAPYKTAHSSGLSAQVAW